jgi:hypothetical protein
MTSVRLGIAAAALLACTTAFAQAKRDWTIYEPSGGGFRVDLPGKPTIKSATTNSNFGPVKSTYASTSTDSDLACTARFGDYQPGATGSDPQVYFNRVMRNFAQFSTRSEERFKIGNMSVLRFAVDMPDKSALDQAMISGDHEITLVCTFPKGQENSPDVRRVFNSLALTKQ